MNVSLFSRMTKLLAGALGAFAMSLSASSYAEVTLANVPLFLTTQVKPNIMLAIDDSGSMDGEVLFPTNDGAAWWSTDSKAFTGTGAAATTLNFNLPGTAGSTWKKFVYLFPNGQSGSYDGRRIYNDGTNDHFAIPPIAQLGWARSSAFNKAYFDPLTVYAPWPSTTNKVYSQSSPSAAKYDPEYATTVDLTVNTEKTDDNWRFRFYNGMVLESGVRIRDGSNWTTLSAPLVVSSDTTVKNNTTHSISYFPATFYTKNKLPASYGYKDSLLSTQSGFSPGAVSADLWKYEIKPENFSTPAAYTAAINNFANWFTYYRKRHLATRGGVAQSFQDIRTARVGYFRINNRINTIAMRDLTSADNRTTFFDGIYSSLNGVGFGGTPNREAMHHAGDRFSNQSDIIQYSCQSNAAILFTDGYSNATTGSNIGSPGNADGTKGTPYADAVSDTMADIAMKYFEGSAVPLRSGTNFPAGRVPVPSECSLTNRDPSLDCNRNLHMNSYAVTLGTSGTVYNPATPVNPYQNPPTWPTSFTDRNPSAVDDLWHATINGRGALLNANTPAEVSSEMKKILDTILARVGSASSVAANSTRLDTGTLIYQAKFDSTDWSGEVLAYSIGAQGDIASQQWSTNTTMPAASARTIMTWNGTAGQSFHRNNWSTLSAAQQAALGSEAEGKDRIDWVRGVRSKEVGQDGGIYRKRTRVLGDVINSDPVFSGAEDYRYQLLGGAEGESYRDFVTTTKATRAPLLLFGANDGMLHGLHAANGTELFGYVPGSVYPKLSRLTSPTYTHEYLVDGTVRVGDAYLNSAWKTVAVGSTGAGGPTIFALDVTNPSSFGAGNVLWEATGAVGTAQIGTGINQPTIVRLATGQWAAVFGNGYNSGDTVKLVIVNLADGTLIKEIDTGRSGANNGLGPVAPVDFDGDRITDAVYAGDLDGNLWRFNIATSNASQWDVSQKSGNTVNPIFRAMVGTTPQPITSRPVIGNHPDGGYMVYFGTGSYFREGDNIVGTNPQLQRFYGIRDSGAAVSVADLTRQTIIVQKTIQGFGPARIYSDDTVNYPTKKGWYLDLSFPADGSGNGERVVSTPILRFGRIIFTSIIPSSDPCEFGGTSWINELDAVSGGRLTYSVFDINGDGLIDDRDFETVDGEKLPVGGKGFTEIIKTPGIVGAGEKEYKYTSGSSGTLTSTAEAGDPAPIGRQSWRQLQ